MATLYVGSRSRQHESEFLSDRHPQLPSVREDCTRELSIAYGDRSVKKLQARLNSGQLTNDETKLALNLIARQMPAAADDCIRSGCMRDVLKFTYDEDPQIRLEAARIVADCVALPAGAEELLYSQRVHTLFTLVGSDGVPATRAVLVKACRELSLQASVQADLAQDGEAELQALLQSAATTPAVTEAISNLAAAGCSPLLLTLGCPAVLTSSLGQAMETGDEGTVYFCLSGLRSLAAESEDAKDQVISAGCMEAVLHCLDHLSSRTRGAAAGLLALLAILLRGTQTALAGGAPVVWRLIKLVHDGNKVTGAQAREAIRTLVSNKAGRTVFLDALLRDPRSIVEVLGMRASADLIAMLDSPRTGQQDKECALRALVALAEAGHDCLWSISDSPAVVRILQAVAADKANSPPMVDMARQLMDTLADNFEDMRLAFRP